MFIIPHSTQWFLVLALLAGAVMWAVDPLRMPPLYKASKSQQLVFLVAAALCLISGVTGTVLLILANH